jgi:hypothetical protein
MSRLENGSVVLCKATGSTSRCASPSLHVSDFGFGKANIKSTLFVSNVQLISMESSTKPK